MAPVDPAQSSPPPLPAHRDPGDAWVEAPDGQRYWGRFGAAGILVHDPARGVLLQHRAQWSHHGGTWGVPGGALHQGEDALTGALREAAEEASVPADALAPVATLVADREVWRYTTLVAEASRPFEPYQADAESLELRWVSLDEVTRLPLHPAFAAAWRDLHSMVRTRVSIVVDVANVVGSVPDGWWRDRSGAADRLIARIARWAREGVGSHQFELTGDLWFPRIEAVVEGHARGAGDHDGVTVSRATGHGDDAIADAVRARVEAGETVVAVTSDRGLTARVREDGARVWASGALLRLLSDGP